MWFFVLNMAVPAINVWVKVRVWVTQCVKRRFLLVLLGISHEQSGRVTEWNMKAKISNIEESVAIIGLFSIGAMGKLAKNSKYWAKSNSK